MLRTDGDGEFVNTKLNLFLSSHGITHHTTCPYTSSQNGIAERKHRHVIETIIALLQTASMPMHFWGEASLTVIFLINRMLSSILNGDTPYFRLFSTLPDYNFYGYLAVRAFPGLGLIIRANFSHSHLSVVFSAMLLIAKGIGVWILLLERFMSLVTSYFGKMYFRCPHQVPNPFQWLPFLVLIQAWYFRHHCTPLVLE